MATSDEQKAQFRQAWQAAGEAVLASPRIDGREIEQILRGGIARAASGLLNIGIGIGIPCAPGRSTVEETLGCVSRLAYDYGYCPQTVQSFEVANNREHLVEKFINSGFKRMLFLDSDTVVEQKGIEQLMETMDRSRVAMVAAVVPQRYTGTAEYNVFLDDGNGGNIVMMREHLPSTGVAFPAKAVGLAVALLDLDKIKEVSGPRFKRVAEGKAHYGEDIAFCAWLTKHELDFLVDPKVRTIHCVQHRFMFEWKPESQAT